MRRTALLLLLLVVAAALASPRQLCLEQPFSLVAVNGNEGVYCGDRGSADCGLAWRLQLTPLGGRSANFTLNTVSVTTDLYDDLLGALEEVSGWAVCTQQLVPSVRAYVSFRGGYLSWRFRYARGNCSSFSQPTGYTLYGTLPDGTTLVPISSTNFSGLVVPCSAAPPPPPVNGQDQPSAVCGNGVLEGNEQCDPPGPCCSDFCEFREPGTACDDGDACTVQDHCAGGAECLGTPLNCDDDQQCTRDSCVAGQCSNEWQLKQRGCRQGPPPPLPACASNCSSVLLADYCRAAGIRSAAVDGDDSDATGLVAAVAVLSLLCAVLIVLLVVVSVWGLGFVAKAWSLMPSLDRAAPPADAERLVYQAPPQPEGTPEELAAEKATAAMISRAMDQVNARAETDQRLRDELDRQRALAALAVRQEQERAAAGAAAPVSPAAMSPFEQQRAAHARQQAAAVASPPIAAPVHVQPNAHWSQAYGTLGGPSGYTSASTGVTIPGGWPSAAAPRHSPPPEGFSEGEW